MCCHSPQPHIYFGTAKVSDGIREGGGGTDELLSFREQGMIHGPGEEVEEESGEAGQVQRERYVGFFSLFLLHRGLGGHTGEIFPPVAEKLGESGMDQSVLRNGPDHSRRGC